MIRLDFHDCCDNCKDISVRVSERRSRSATSVDIWCSRRKVCEAYNKTDTAGGRNA